MYVTEGGSRRGDDATAKQRSHACQFDQMHCRAKVHGTCSEASFLLSLAQVAVGAEVGVGGWLRLAWFGPAFPLDEVGDPALGQGGGLCHMVPHCLRNTWAHRRVGEGVVRSTRVFK